jgi:hypothetical protein
MKTWQEELAMLGNPELANRIANDVTALMEEAAKKAPPLPRALHEHVDKLRDFLASDSPLALQRAEIVCCWMTSQNGADLGDFTIGRAAELLALFKEHFPDLMIIRDPLRLL